MDLDTSDLTSNHYPIAEDHLPLISQDITMTDSDPGQQNAHIISSSDPKWHSSNISGTTECMDFAVSEDRFRNGNCQLENVMEKHLGVGDGGGVGDATSDLLSLSDDGVPEISNSDLSVPEVCISTNTVNDDEDLSYECQQAYRIFNCFLLDKYKGITAPFLHPIGHREAHQGIGGVRGLGRGPGQVQLRQSMCLRRMEEKFANREYETITEFVADFRLMLENCYRHHGVDHWVSKQAQKLEIMLEQKLTLLSRTLREKTTLAVTSKGRFGAEEERGSGGTSTRRRSAPRSLATITVGGHESVMVQALRLEEQQRAKEERRQRELDKKEAEETSAKEVEEWERSLLTQAFPHTISILWELPAIGHFLCLAQTALNLPEIIFFELERCLLMPRCSVFLSKIMSSLLCPPQRRPTLNRRPALPYRRWESELRQKVQGWYRAVGSAKDQAVRAGLLGLSYQFFQTLGEVSPLEETPFHLLPVYQRLWLVKALCDNVYETQKDVQDVVLGQPIHECRESVLGYDGKDNAYIHFPHFCGADLRIYCQSPSTPPRFPLPAVWVRRVEPAEGERKEAEDAKQEEEEEEERACGTASAETGGSSTSTSSSKEEEEEEEEEEDKKHLERDFRGQNGGRGTWSLTKEAREEDSESTDEEDCKPNLLNTRTPSTRSRAIVKVESEEESRPSRVSLKGQRGSPWVLGQHGRVKAEIPEPCLSVGEHSYMGRSPARSSNDSLSTHARSTEVSVKLEGKIADGHTAPCPECSRANAEKKDSHQTSPKKTKVEGPVEATFKLVCTSLEELRELISKTEDELDELESTKKRAAQQARWFQKRESVKELHITLIRLLNELSPWEPKLIKAFHRNRLRLKRDFDDFRKHPEYDNFVREECLSSSEDEEDMSVESFTCSEQGRLTEEEDPLEHSVPRGLWTGDTSRHLMSESAGDSLLVRGDLSPKHLKQLSSSADEELGLHKRLRTASGNTAAASESSQQHRSKTCRTDNDPPPAAGSPQTPSRPIILHPTIGLPKGYTPIPTLLAKSVGNKVTLMKRPADHPSVNKQMHSKARLVSMPTSTVGKPPQAAGSLSPPAIPISQQQSPKQSVPVCRHLAPATITTTATACNPSSQQTAVPKTPVQLVYKVAEGLGHLLRKDGVGSSSPLKISVQPVVDQKTGEKTFQQVVLLPHNLLVPEKTPALQQHHQQQQQQQQQPQPQPPKTPVSKIPTPLSTSVSGFTIPDGKIPIQQVAPLKDTRTARTPSPAASPRLQSPTASPGFKVVPLPGSPRASTPLSKTPSPSRSPISSPPASTASNDSGKYSETRQELKTVCIRDSQSILVTTRGGNTGVVKVQTSTDQNSPGSLPTSPVISICPQFKAFLVSKSSSPSASPPTPVSRITHAAQPSSPMKPPGASGNPTHPVTSASTGTVQQRIVINTSAPLAAGTQIVLNGTRFVVPPQGLGPGSHVLIISTPAPPPTTATTAITAAGAPPRGPSVATTAPPGPAAPWVSPVRLPGTPALRPAGLTVGTLGAVSAPRGSPLPAGASSLVSALPTVRLPGASAPLVSSVALGPPRSAGTVSPIVTRTPALGSIVPSAKLAGTPSLAPHLLSRSSIAPGPPAPDMLRLPVSTPVQCFPVVPSTPVAALPTPAIPALAPLPPPLAQPTYVLTSPPPALGPTLLSQPGPVIRTTRPGAQLHKAALRLSAPSVQQGNGTTTGLTNKAITAQAAGVVQTVSPRSTPVLPTAAPSIGSRVFRMQSLPVATVPPSHIIKTSAQPLGKVTTPEATNQPVLSSTATPAVDKTPLQSSAPLIHTNLAPSKQLLSPDGAVLNTVPGLVNPVGLPVISTKHLATLVVTPSSTAGQALPIPFPSTTTHTDSPRLQSAQPDSSEPINPASS
ncbi:putative bromodomain-containing protein 10 [Aplochiton taeniatus]